MIDFVLSMLTIIAAICLILATVIIYLSLASSSKKRDQNIKYKDETDG